MDLSDMIDFRSQDKKVLEQLLRDVLDELNYRKELEFKDNNICPDCNGTGYVGDEWSHTACERCKITGKYFEEE